MYAIKCTPYNVLHTRRTIDVLHSMYGVRYTTLYVRRTLYSIHVNGKHIQGHIMARHTYARIIIVCSLFARSYPPNVFKNIDDVSIKLVHGGGTNTKKGVTVAVGNLKSKQSKPTRWLSG